MEFIQLKRNRKVKRLVNKERCSLHSRPGESSHAPSSRGPSSISAVFPGSTVGAFPSPIQPSLNLVHEDSPGGGASRRKKWRDMGSRYPMWIRAFENPASFVACFDWRS